MKKQKSLELGNFEHPVISEDLRLSLQDEEYFEKISGFDSPLILDLQRMFEKLFGIKHILATNSGTSAIFEMFYTADLKKDDEVIVPAYTFFATATPLFVLGCKPVLADALPNGNIDPKDIEKKITKKTKAIIITHIWGIPCDMTEIMAISNKYGIPVLEDSSHAHGAKYDGRVLGTFGLSSAWSLGAKKLITGGQGGIFGTNDKKVFQKAVLLGHANNKRIKEITDDVFMPFATTGVGLNLRMHPFSAALILDQLRNFKKHQEERREIAEYLSSEIKKIPGLEICRVPLGSEPAWYAFPILFNQDFFKGTTKHEFVKLVTAENCPDIDIPQTTCSLSHHPIFNIENINLGEKNVIKTDMDALHGTISYESRLFKLPVWYGKDRFKYADHYLNKIKKVATQLEK